LLLQVVLLHQLLPFLDYQVNQLYQKLMLVPAFLDTTTPTDNGPQLPDATTGVATTSDSFAPYTSQADKDKANADAGAKQSKDAAISCSVNIVCGFVKIISFLTMYIPNALVTISGIILDFTIYGTIQHSNYDLSTNGFAATGWKLVRDISNLVFIFALFVIAFNLILNSESNSNGKITVNNSFGMDPKRTFARVLMMALLVNFSFFLGSSLIGITNTFGQFFYNKISTASTQSKDTISENSTDLSTALQPSNIASLFTKIPELQSISLSVVNMVNPQQLILQTGGTQSNYQSWWRQALSKIGVDTYDDSFYTMYLLLSVMSGIFNLFLCYIFISIAILIMGRTFGLIFGLILSPIAFVSFTVPALQKQSYVGFDDWLEQFVGLAFVGPIFIFFMYLAVMFLNVSLLVLKDPTWFTEGNIMLTIIAISLKLGAVAFVFILSKRITKQLAGKVGAFTRGVVVNVAVDVALIGAAAATGGGSEAAFLMARRIATNHVKDGAVGIGNRVLGNEKTAALQQRLGGLRNLRTLPSSPRDAVMGLANTVTMNSKAPGQINSALTEGTVFGRAVNIKNIREERLAKEAGEAKRKEEEAAKKAALPKTPPKPTFTYAPGNTVINKTENSPVGPQNQAKPTNTSQPTNFGPQTAETAAANKFQMVQPSGTFAPKSSSATPVADSSLKATNVFNGNVDFDRPKQQSTTPSGLAQKEESQKLTSLYTQTQKAKDESINVENLTVNAKNLNLKDTSEPSKAVLPSRSAQWRVAPQQRATTLLSGIQMTPEHLVEQ
jgi:hypothetical protein